MEDISLIKCCCCCLFLFTRYYIFFIRKCAQMIIWSGLCLVNCPVTHMQFNYLFIVIYPQLDIKIMWASVRLRPFITFRDRKIRSEKHSWNLWGICKIYIKTAIKQKQKRINLCWRAKTRGALRQQQFASDILKTVSGKTLPSTGQSLSLTILLMAKMLDCKRGVEMNLG